MIRAYGSLVCIWTMQFEAKHSFCKRVVRHTHSFRNILQSRSVKHQLMVAYNEHDSSVVRLLLQAAILSTVHCKLSFLVRKQCVLHGHQVHKWNDLG